MPAEKSTEHFIEAVNVLRGARAAVLYSLEPLKLAIPGEEHLHSHPIRGKTSLDENQTIMACAAVGISEMDWGEAARCFFPRHGLRIEKAGHEYDFVVCYECHWLRVFRDGIFLENALVRGTPYILNQMLSAVGIPVASAPL